MINPYFLYFSSFVISTLVYQLNWSLIYPDMNPDLLLFLSMTFLIALLMGILFKKKFVIYPRNISSTNQSGKILLITYFFWALEFAYGGGLPPIILAMQGIRYELADFGIPTFHVFLYTFSSFFSTYLFHSYLSGKSKEKLRLYILSFLPFLLLLGRGAILMNLFSSLFLYLNLNFKIDSRKKITISIKIFLISALVILSTFFIFGAAGNTRTAAVYERDDYNIILDIGKATTEFRNSVIPKEFFWTYLYIASPIGNLQQSITNSKISNLTSDDIIHFVSNEIMPDFIAKRLNELFSFTKKTIALSVDELNVSTVYANSFMYLSWIGLFIMSLFIMIFPFAYISILGDNNPFYLVGLSTLNTMYLFLMFDNMFAFSGLSLQLLYPLIMPKIMGIKSLD